MKSFKEFIQESSLTRLKSKSDKGGMAVLSGSRGDKSANDFILLRSPPYYLELLSLITLINLKLILQIMRY